MDCKPKCRYYKQTVYVAGEPFKCPDLGPCLTTPPDCEFTGEPKVKVDDPASLSSHLQGIWDDICWMRQNQVRYTDVQSPSELAANHPAFEVYVATTGNDTTGKGTIAEPFATPYKAIDYIHRYVSPRDIGMVINMADGVYGPYDNILNLVHASGNSILLKGESSGGVTINFTGGGITGIRNGEIENLIIEGNGTAGPGWSNPSGETLSAKNCSISNFAQQGFYGIGGWIAFYGSNNASNCGSGFLAEGCVMAALGGAVLTSNSNNIGFNAIRSASIDCINSISTNNASFGYYAASGSNIKRTGNTVSGNGTDYSPALGVDGNGNSHIF